MQQSDESRIDLRPKSWFRTMLVGFVVFFGATIAIYFALKPEPKLVQGVLRRGMPIGAVMFGLGGGTILSILAMAIDWSWQGQRRAKKRPELA